MHNEHRHIRQLWQTATWLRERLHEPPRVGELACHAGLSERHFHRLFTELLGETPADHVLRLRLEHASAWLAYTDFPVMQAALAGGYESREAFTRAFHARFGCTPVAFRDRLRALRRRVPLQPPAGLGTPGERILDTLRVAAWPHLGPSARAVTAWLSLGRWGRKHGVLEPGAVPVSVLFDDEVITPPDKCRLDAALALPPSRAVPDADVPPAWYELPGGRYVAATYEGAVGGLAAAWDYFGLRWFPASGLALRDWRLLMLHEPADVPTRVCDLFPLVMGRPIRCQLCIPVDSVPAHGLPPVQRI
jgi:AraC family transcriptional regulator